MEKVYDIIIIGAGPAGMSSAVYGVRAGLKVLVIEQSGMPGGQVLSTYEVDNYLGLPGVSGFELGMKFKEHAENLDVSIVEGEVYKISEHGDLKEVFTEEGSFRTKTVIFATGAKHAKLKVEGEEELAGMGVSYCATCDGAFFKGKTVAVVGGSDVAVEDAIFLARTSEKVYLVHRRDELRAAKSLQETLFQLKNIEILWDSAVVSINGTKNVESVTILNKKTNEQKDYALQGVFIAVGMLPETELLDGFAERDEKGYIMAAEDCVTSKDGFFVAGDARTKGLRQIITAVADGANAVASAEKHINTLNGKNPLY